MSDTGEGPRSMQALSWFEARMSQDPGDFWRERGLPGAGEDGCQGQLSLLRGKAGALSCEQNLLAQGLEAKKRSRHSPGGSE